jgi:HEAT repeat protein
MGIRVAAQESAPAATSQEPQLTGDDACPASLDRLLLLLKSEQPMTRVAAADCLGDVRDNRAVEPLVNAILNERYPRIVLSYEKALAAIDDPRTAELLVAALKSPKTRSRAAESLGSLHLKSGVDPLLNLLKSPDARDRSTAASSLGSMKDSRAVDPLCAALNDEDEVVRRSVVLALGDIGNNRAVDSLIAALRDDDEGVRRNAANALGNFKDSSAVESLSQALSDDDDRVQQDAADALGKIADPQAAEALAAAVQSGNNALQAHSAAALSDIRAPQSAQTLIRSLKQGRLNIVAAGYRFFVRRGDPDSIPALIEALNEHGDERMAGDLMYCGNSQLAEAASDWAKRNKADIMYPPQEPVLVWASEN